MKQLFVIGNGPVAGRHGGMVEAADRVVRFNEPRLAPEMSGTRTDWLFVANSGKHMQRRVADPDHLASPAVAAARRVFLAYHPDVIARYHPKPNLLSRLKGRRADWTVPALMLYGRAGKEVTVLAPSFYEESCRVLAIPPGEMRSVFPSTGLLAIRYVLGECDPQEWRINICGFTFEGWKRHAWGDERGLVMKLAEEGRIAVWP